MTTKSTSITNLDATPVVTSTAGEGAAANLKHINDYATAPITTGAGGITQLVRIPSTAKVKELHLGSAAQTQGTYDIGLYFSSSTKDGTAPGLQGVVLDADFFASAVDCSSAVVHTDITNESGTYTVDKRNQPIWQAAGWSRDPGGFLDVCATTTITTTVGGLMGVDVKYTN